MCDSCGEHEALSTKEHRKSSEKQLKFAVLTISTSKYTGDGEDVSGEVIARAAEEGGHTVIERDIVSDEEDMIRGKVLSYAETDADIIVTTGGTGLSPRDVTIEAVKPVFDKELSGFNPLFMHLSYGTAGSACVLSRATAGIVKKKVVFCLPGSPDACRLAMSKIILPEAGHVKKHSGE